MQHLQALTSVASKGLTEKLTPLEATLTKNRGAGPLWLQRFPFPNLAAKQVDLNSLGAPSDEQRPLSLRIRFTLDRHRWSRSRSLAPWVITSVLRQIPRRLDTSHRPKMLEWFQGATRFRRKLSRHEGMPGTTCPQRGGKLEMPTTTWHLQLN